MPVQLRRGRWDEEDNRGASSSGSEADGVPAVKPGNMSKREWELLQEARELEQGAFAFDKSVSQLLCMRPAVPKQFLSQAACRDGIAMQPIIMHITAMRCLCGTNRHQQGQIVCTGFHIHVTTRLKSAYRALFGLLLVFSANWQESAIPLD